VRMLTLQFKAFFNLYFLLVALSQAVPSLRIGYLSAYIAPLILVLGVTMGREGLDDLARRRRDKEANSEFYEVVGMTRPVRSRDLHVGDLVKVHKDQRLPADIMLLRTADGTGEAFIRTDQLDGETDWKLRTAPGFTQTIQDEESLLSQTFSVTAEPPMKDLYKFNGTLAQSSTTPRQECGVGAESMMWANAVLASGPYIVGLVLYTGIETRQAQNTSKARVKFGLLEHEINNLSKILCGITLGLSVLLVAVHRQEYPWYISIMRFLILFSTIIPIRYFLN
jgi:phospholipid-translocating ATPase